MDIETEKLITDGKLKLQDYESIPSNPQGYFMNFPGIYCKNCGRTYALYSFSVYPADDVDEMKKPFYKNCPKCYENTNK